MTPPAGGQLQPGQGGRAPQPGAVSRAPQPGAVSRAPQPGAVSRAPQPERSRLTSRAAVLAVVICAIALSLAYPVREYIAQRRQIDQLETQRQAIAIKLGSLERQQRLLATNAYVEQQARDRLHMCMPAQKCYVIINPRQPPEKTPSGGRPSGTPWYERLWSSVQRTDRASAR